MKNTRPLTVSARQYDLLNKITVMREKGVEELVLRVGRKYDPKIKELETRIRAFHEKYIWDLSFWGNKEYPPSETGRMKIEYGVTYNPDGPTPKPSQRELGAQEKRERELYNLRLKVISATAGYMDLLTEFLYWHRKYGPLPQIKKVDIRGYR